MITHDDFLTTLILIRLKDLMNQIIYRKNSSARNLCIQRSENNVKILIFLYRISTAPYRLN